MRNTWPGVPSLRPNTSLRITSECVAQAVPPMVIALIVLMRGEAEYDDCLGRTGVSPTLLQPARLKTWEKNR